MILGSWGSNYIRESFLVLRECPLRFAVEHNMVNYAIIISQYGLDLVQYVRLIHDNSDLLKLLVINALECREEWEIERELLILFEGIIEQLLQYPELNSNLLKSIFKYAKEFISTDDWNLYFKTSHCPYSLMQLCCENNLMECFKIVITEAKPLPDYNEIKQTYEMETSFEKLIETILCTGNKEALLLLKQGGQNIQPNDFVPDGASEEMVTFYKQTFGFNRPLSLREQASFAVQNSLPYMHNIENKKMDYILKNLMSFKPRLPIYWDMKSIKQLDLD